MARRRQINSDYSMIEVGGIDILDFGVFYPRGVIDMLDKLHKDKKYLRPRGTESPSFTTDEVWDITEYIFFKAADNDLINNIREFQATPGSLGVS